MFEAPRAGLSTVGVSQPQVITKQAVMTVLIDDALFGENKTIVDDLNYKAMIYVTR